MKKLLSFVLAFCLFLTVLPLYATAETMTGICGNNLSYTLDLNTKTLTITGTGSMDDFGQNGEPVLHPAGANAWNNYHDQIETIHIGEGVTTIGNQAFYRFSALTRVELPESLTQIGCSAFYGCVKLAEIQLPTNLQQLATGAFDHCESLNTLTLPAALTSFSPLSVTGCANLATFAVAEGNTAFAAQNGVLFSKDGNVLVCYPQGKVGNSYVVPNEVKEIGDRAFESAKIKQISMPDSVTKLGCGAFVSSGLTEFTVPKTISSVPESLLSGCASLKKVTLHEGVTVIGPSAFSECAALTEIGLPAGLQRIGYYAFMGCTALRNVSLPEGLSALEYSAFSSSGISTLTIPASITVLDNDLLSGCVNLTEVKLHDGITSLGYGLFYGCTALEHISLPESVTEIKPTCFAGSGLKEFTFPKGVTRVENQLFENCTALKTVDCSGIERVCLDAFRNCAALETITFGSSLVEISDGAFDGCKALREVYYNADGNHWRSVTVSTVRNDSLLVAMLHTTDGTTMSFIDVDPNAYYAAPVTWAVENGVTNGTEPGKFSPDATCTRAQVVTFLWRAKGCPEPTKTDNQFKDIKETDYFYKAVLWAVENEVTNGVAADYFAPNADCTRGQVVTFQWRAEGKPNPTKTDNQFKDVKEGDFYYNAVLWAVEKEITNGTAANAFSPLATCTRGQIVTFLYRDLAK